MNICKSKFQLKDLSKIDLKEILNYYKNEENNDDDTDLTDIYYLNYYNKNNKEKGAFSDNFLEKHKNHKNIQNMQKTI